MNSFYSIQRHNEYSLMCFAGIKIEPIKKIEKSQKQVKKGEKKSIKKGKPGCVYGWNILFLNISSCKNKPLSIPCI